MPITTVLSTASGTVTTATQIFSSANASRTAVLIANCDATNNLYVGHTSDVSSSKHSHKLLPGDTLLVYVGTAVPFYLNSTSAAYCAHELIAYDG